MRSTSIFVSSPEGRGSEHTKGNKTLLLFAIKLIYIFLLIKEVAFITKTIEEMLQGSESLHNKTHNGRGD